MPVLLDLFVYAILLGGLLVCIWGVGRIWHRQAVLRYEPRRQVPWEGIDLLLILCAFVLLQWQCITLGLKLAGVDDHGQPWELARGWARLDPQEPLTTTHRFPVYAISTLIAATAVLRLVADGRLELDGPVNDHLRTIRLADDHITVRDLLTQLPGRVANIADHL